MIETWDRKIEDWYEVIKELIDLPRHQRLVRQTRKTQDRREQEIRMSHQAHTTRLQQQQVEFRAKFPKKELIFEDDPWLEEDATVTFNSDNTSDVFSSDVSDELESVDTRETSVNTKQIQRGTCRTCSACVIS